MTLSEKREKLEALLRAMGSAAVAYSAGVDSTLLLKLAHDVLGPGAVAVTVRSAFCPPRESREAEEFCRREGIEHVLLDVPVLTIPAVADNPPDRCYLCKKALFARIGELAAGRGLRWVAEGSNLDDLGDYRPGMRAVAELGVRSPLREAELTKSDVRALSRELGLPTWDKPSAACLASRFAYGERLTEERLARVDEAEQYLRSLGFSQVRVRVHAALGRIEVPAGELPALLDAAREIHEHLRALGFAYVTADLGGFQSGSMNRTLSE